MFKKRRVLCFLFLLLLTILTKYVYAETIYVNSGGNIQEAIDQAVSGDTVFILPGTYEENIFMKDGVDLKGESYYGVTLEGKIICKDVRALIKNITIHYCEGDEISYTNNEYPDWKVRADSGIVGINSAIDVNKCVIRPHPDYLADNFFEYYGNGIQLWNLSLNPTSVFFIQDTLIQNAEHGIFCYSQVFSGGPITGFIKNNTFYRNRYGIVFRMHNENPGIFDNIFAGQKESAILYTYKEPELFGKRLDNIINNLFHGNEYDLWVDAGHESFNLVTDLDNANISGDPFFINPDIGGFYITEGSPAAESGLGGEHIGAYGVDNSIPSISNLMPDENAFMGDTPYEITLSGTVSDDSGILSVLVNDQPAVLFGDTFTKDCQFSEYGVDDVSITATDLARKSKTVVKNICLFRKPIGPPPGVL